MADESDPRKLRAHELLDRAAVALEDVPRHLVVAGKDAPDLLRVLALAERGRARDVAEEDGHRLPGLEWHGGGGGSALPQAAQNLAASGLRSPQRAQAAIARVYGGFGAVSSCSVRFESVFRSERGRRAWA